MKLEAKLNRRPMVCLKDRTPQEVLDMHRRRVQKNKKHREWGCSDSGGSAGRSFCYNFSIIEFLRQAQSKISISADSLWIKKISVPQTKPPIRFCPQNSIRNDRRAKRGGFLWLAISSLVRPAGLEPTTPCSEDKCSIHWATGAN